MVPDSGFSSLHVRSCLVDTGPTFNAANTILLSFYVSLKLTFLYQVFANEPVIYFIKKKKKRKKKPGVGYKPSLDLSQESWEMSLHLDTAASLTIADSSAFNFAPAKADSLGDCGVSGGLQIEATLQCWGSRKKKKKLFSDWTIYLLDVTLQTHTHTPADEFLLYRTVERTRRVTVRKTRRVFFFFLLHMIVILFCQMNIFWMPWAVFEICII